VAEVLLVVVRKAGEKGKLYGAVTSADLVEAAAAKGLELDRKKLRLSEPIKSVGDFEVTVRLHPEVLGVLRVRVVREGDDVAPPLAAAQPIDDSPPADVPGQSAAAPEAASPA
jgi:large subunit ribosomal protein L9